MQGREIDEMVEAHCKEVGDLKAYEDTAQDLHECKRNLTAMVKALREARDVGHNDDCLFCGFKDKRIDAALASAKEKAPTAAVRDVIVERRRQIMDWI